MPTEETGWYNPNYESDNEASTIASFQFDSYEDAEAVAKFYGSGDTGDDFWDSVVEGTTITRYEAGEEYQVWDKDAREYVTVVADKTTYIVEVEGDRSNYDAA